MGLNKYDKKLNVQKEQLKEIMINMCKVNLSIMEFQYSVAKTPKEKRGLNTLIKHSYRAISMIKNVSHYEILISLYNTFVNKKEIYFLSMVKTIINPKTIARWDKSEKGFQEFLKLENNANEMAKQEAKENQEKVEFIKKAKADGKKVEMLFKDGKLKPVIVEETTN